MKTDTLLIVLGLGGLAIWLASRKTAATPSPAAGPYNPLSTWFPGIFGAQQSTARTIPVYQAGPDNTADIINAASNAVGVVAGAIKSIWPGTPKIPTVNHSFNAAVAAQTNNRATYVDTAPRTGLIDPNYQAWV